MELCKFIHISVTLLRRNDAAHSSVCARKPFVKILETLLTPPVSHAAVPLLLPFSSPYLVYPHLALPAFLWLHYLSDTNRPLAGKANTLRHHSIMLSLSGQAPVTWG